MKNVTQGKKANLKSLIRLHSAKEKRIKNCTAGLGGEGEKKKKKQRKGLKNPNEYTEQVKAQE